MEKTFTVIGCNPSNNNTTFVWKLETVAPVKMFGLTKSVKRTYYIGGMPNAVENGVEFKEDITRFDIVERPFELVDDQTGETSTLMLKWLHAKIA